MNWNAGKRNCIFGPKSWRELWRRDAKSNKMEWHDKHCRKYEGENKQHWKEMAGTQWTKMILIWKYQMPRIRGHIRALSKLRLAVLMQASEGQTAQTVLSSTQVYVPYPAIIGWNVMKALTQPKWRYVRSGCWPDVGTPELLKFLGLRSCSKLNARW